MIAICVDDEPILLDWLCNMVSASPDIEQAEGFLNEADALDYASKNPFDLAFLDVELHALDGLAVAERLRAIHPRCGIIFCTGHSDCAVDAIGRLRVDGYLLKPINSAAVQREIDRLKERLDSSEKLLRVDLSHGVNIFDRVGTPVHFRRGKTEELFAELLRQNGKSLSADALCELLWADSAESPYLFEKNKNYLTQLFTDLRHALEECGAQDVLKKTAEGYAVCMPLIALRDRG